MGPSNLNTLLKTIPPYWSTLLATFHKRMGDSEAVLKEESPLFKADQIKVPAVDWPGRQRSPRKQSGERPNCGGYAQERQARPVLCVPR